MGEFKGAEAKATAGEFVQKPPTGLQGAEVTTAAGRIGVESAAPPDPRASLPPLNQPPPRSVSPPQIEAVYVPPPQPVPSGWQSVDDGQIDRQTAEHLQRGFAATSTGSIAPPATLIPEARSALPPAASTYEPPSPPLHRIVVNTGGGLEGAAAVTGAPEQPDHPMPFNRAGVQDGGPSFTVDPSPSPSVVSTTIGVAVLRNRAEIDLLAASFLVLIEDRLEALRQERSNSDEAAALVTDYEDLKSRVEAFLARASQFAEKKTAESAVVTATTSFAEGIGNFWSKHHVQICGKAYDMGLFGIGVAISSLAGNPLAIAIPGVIVGGKPVLEAIKAICSKSKDKP